MAAATPEQIEKILNGPSLAPPKGVAPNFVDPDNFHVWFIATAVPCLTFSTFAVGTRIYTKLFITRKTEWEDYTAFLGWILFVANIALAGLLIKYGGGVHQWNIQLKNISPALYYMNVLSILYCITVSIVKISILQQYLRIFAPTQKANVLYIGSHAVIWTTIIFYLGCTFVEIFICSPRRKFWTPTMTTGHCYNAERLNIAAATFNAVSDWVMLLLPQSSIWKLQMRFKRKVAISAVFFTGFFACVVSVIRLYYAILMPKTSDVTYMAGPLMLWTLAEFSTILICGCMPFLPKFFQNLGESLSSRSYLQTLFNFSKSSGTTAKGSGLSNPSTKNRDLYGPQYQLHEKCESLDERELGEIANEGSIGSNRASDLDRPLQSTLHAAAAQEGWKGRNHSTSQVLKTVRIETMSQAKDITPSALERQRGMAW